MVEAHTDVHYGASGMHYVFKCLEEKKTGRPPHVDQQPEQAAAFKKKTLWN
jgi:hypothetical protein